MRRGIYLLPSLFTLGNIFLGFWAVVRGLAGDFHDAALLIFAAGVLDGLDGRIARLTGTESDFGKEFDSLADVLTFGSTPALLAYLWGLNDLGRIGWLVPFFYLVCCATRLARFNVNTGTVDSKSFVGLPSPAAAASLAAVLILAPQPPATPRWMVWTMLGVVFAIGTLMVSNFRYPSFKRIDLKQRRSFRLLLPLTALLLVVAYHPPAFSLSVAVVYTFYGPIAWLDGLIRRRSRETPKSETEATETS